MHRHSHMPTRAPGGDRGDDWRDRAACRDEDPELFFPPAGNVVSVAYQRQVDAAAAVCGRCPVTTQCLQWAIEHGEDHGVWGGLDPAGRRRAAGQHPPADDRPLTVCAHCGHWFLPRRRDQRYCGHQCHHNSMRLRTAGYSNGCGTAAGARRHRKHGEPVDEACRVAETCYRNELDSGVRQRVPRRGVAA